MSEAAEKPVTPERLMQMAWGYAPPLMIGAAVSLGLFDRLDAGPKSAGELAKEAGASERGVRILMNGLAGVGLVAKDADGRYALTPESSAFLVSSKPSFQGGLFRHVDTQLVPRWLKLTETVRIGKADLAVNEQKPGSEFFQRFVEDIFPMSFPAASALADALKVGDAKGPVRVLDLAAGSGVWGIALAKKSPQVRVTAVDWPDVIPVTKRVAARHGVADRFTFVEGDIQTVDFGKDHDVATLGHILHSEGEMRSRDLLMRTGQALKRGGTIAIGEFLANEDRSGPPNAMIFAVNMLVNTTEGDTFTFGEISCWLREAHFGNIRTLDAPGPSPMILATKE
ncbi:MAG TPA: methyltransferase [Tepidisphaeraceae bacterium]